MSEVTFQDIGRKVRFQRDGRTDEGVIFSFSGDAVDVVYDENDHATWTRPEDLEFV
jgi:hypothetical protein